MFAIFFFLILFVLTPQVAWERRRNKWAKWFFLPAWILTVLGAVVYGMMTTVSAKYDTLALVGLLSSLATLFTIRFAPEPDTESQKSDVKSQIKEPIK